MTDEELKKKCTERAKIFQQAMESCHSSSPIDCIEWFADRIAELEDKLANADYQLEGRDNEIAELEQENKVLAQNLEDTDIVNKALEKENAELRKIAEFQQSSNINKYFENKKLKEGLAVGSTWNKHLNSLNKELEEERDKYRNMVFDKDDQLTKAKELLKRCYDNYIYLQPLRGDIEQFLSEVEK